VGGGGMNIKNTEEKIGGVATPNNPQHEKVGVGTPPPPPPPPPPHMPSYRVD